MPIRVKTREGSGGGGGGLSTTVSSRTLDTTLFGTRARHLASSCVFRWSAQQTDVFRAFISEKYPNHKACDLGPLLKALDLDGFENMHTNGGESVHRLVVDKVKTKIQRTEKAMLATGVSWQQQHQHQQQQQQQQPGLAFLPQPRQVNPEQLPASGGPTTPSPSRVTPMYGYGGGAGTDSGAGTRHLRGGRGRGRRTKSARQGHIERMEETLLDFGHEVLDAHQAPDETEEWEEEMDDVKHLYERLLESLKDLKLLPPAEE